MHQAGKRRLGLANVLTADQAAKPLIPMSGHVAAWFSKRVRQDAVFMGLCQGVKLRETPCLLTEMPASNRLRTGAFPEASASD
jgi:hypothetical protein